MVKLIRLSEKNFNFKIFIYIFDLQLGLIPPLSSTDPFKKSFLVISLLMSDISKKAEACCDQNDPWPCLKGGKLGRKNATPTKLFCVDSYDPNIMSFVTKPSVKVLICNIRI